MVSLSRLVTVMASCGAQSAYAVSDLHLCLSSSLVYDILYYITDRYCRGSKSVLPSNLQLYLYVGHYILVLLLQLNDSCPFKDRWMLVISTQLIGFSIGGIARRFLVSPPSMSKYPRYQHGIFLISAYSLAKCSCIMCLV